ncbi:MAG: helix-turn-helix transcriptional regulator [Clostridia bacterium]|nr:helix-turn-helix transcriptional regulator [Clostridia bacterium]
MAIGQFIAALRKANGMTQQEVADRLNVSNKAVSRWEREETAPDLSLIPALAELFGVTCDELLRGERSRPEKPLQRPGRQLDALARRAMIDFKTVIWISLALSLVGVICMFGISYGFYKPVIGFAVLLLFEVAAVVAAAIAVNKIKELLREPELLKDPHGLERCLGQYGFSAFFTALAGVLFSLPLICFSPYGGVLTFESYLINFFLPIGLILILVLLKGRAPFIAWFTGHFGALHDPAVRQMDLLQWGVLLLAGILFIAAPYGDMDPYKTDPVFIAINLAAEGLLVSNIVIFGIYLKKKGKGILLPGIRNVLLTPLGQLFSEIHSMGFVWFDENPTENTLYERYDHWDWQPLAVIVIGTILIFTVFEIINYLNKLLEER